jgi:hypothetical protein
MTTPRVLFAALAALGVLALADGDPRLRWGLPAVLLVALLATGELWLRALIAETIAPAARVGFGGVCGLAGLPLVAIVLHVLSVPVRVAPIAAGLAVLCVLLGTVALLRSGRTGAAQPADPRFARTLVAMAVPAVVTLLIGGSAAIAYVRLPHPPQPGFTSLALAGWAAAIDGPVTFPRAGLDVPVQVSSSGAPATVAQLRVRVGDRPAAPPRPVTVAADTTRTFDVHVPSPVAGCLHRIEISVGAASTTFYGRGPAAC